LSTRVNIRGNGRVHSRFREVAAKAKERSIGAKKQIKRAK
jgi:hypothetical protein